MKKINLENLNERLNELSESGRHVLEEYEIEKRAEEVRDKTEKLIRKHPLASIGIGLAVGYLIGRIFSRD